MSRGYSCAHPWNGEWSHTTRLSVNIGNLLIIVIRFEKQRDHDQAKRPASRSCHFTVHCIQASLDYKVTIGSRQGSKMREQGTTVSTLMPNFPHFICGICVISLVLSSRIGVS